LLLTGTKGTGKSTTAAAMAAQGATVMADDIGALDVAATPPRVFSAEARLRMMPDAVTSVVGEGAVITPMWSTPKSQPLKTFVRTGPDERSEAPDSAPIAAVYVLEPRQSGATTTTIELVPPAAALPLLMAHRGADLMPDLATARTDFANLGRLVTSVPVNRVWRTSRIEDVPATCRLLLADAAAAATSKAPVASA
jgi:hypothetical protein